jgi:hypothetical protein
VMSLDEMKRLLVVATSLKARVLLSLGYGCGLIGFAVAREDLRPPPHVGRSLGPGLKWRALLGKKLKTTPMQGRRLA